MKLLENELVKLRALEPADVELLYQWENDTEIWTVSNTIAPFSKYLLKQYVENSHLSIYEAGQLKLMIGDKLSFETVGSVDLFDFDVFHQRAGIGILIHNKEHRRKGLATAALEIIINYAFNYLKLNQLYCNISETNTASLKLFEKMGFELIGVKKKWTKSPEGWIDELFFQLINE